MGKAKKPRTKKARSNANPISRKTELTTEEEAAHKKTILPLIEKLGSAKPEDRSMAISAITALTENANIRQMLLKEKLLHTVMKQSISDSSEEVISEAYGLLRNLVIEDGYDIAIFLHRQDILTAIEGKLTKLKEVVDVESFKEKPAAEKKVIFTQLENIIGLISAISISSNDIFNAIDKKLPNLALFLIQLLSICSPTENPSLFTTICEGLYFHSEDNERVVSQIGDYPFKELSNNQDIPNASRVYVNGVLFNAYVEQGTPDHEALCEILKSLSATINNVDLEKAKQNIEPKIENDTPVNINEFNTATAEARSAMDTVQMSLELFTAIAEVVSVDPSVFKARAEEEEEAEDEMVMDEENDNDDDDGELDMSDDAYIQGAVQKEEDDDDLQIDNDISFDNNDGAGASDPAVVFLHENILPLVIKYLSEPLFASRAMAALNNVCWTLTGALDATSNESWKSNAADLWYNVSAYIRDSPLDISTSAMGVLWAVSSAFKGDVPITTDQINFISNQCSEIKPQSTNNEQNDATEYMIRSTGLIGTVGMTPGRLEITRASSDFLTSIIFNALDCPVAVVVQALNVLFELFNDNKFEYDEPVFVKGDVLGTLNKSLPNVRKAVKRVDKKKYPELRANADEAALNLSRFIDYKKKERR